MKEKDYEYIATVERAIEEKYGEETIQHPRANWDEDKEKQYLEQIKDLQQKQRKISEAKDKVEVDGFLMSKKLLTREVASRTCPVCSSFSFSVKDDVYMNKFDCCFSCYVKWVENREERWLDGWRPNKSGD